MQCTTAQEQSTGTLVKLAVLKDLKRKILLLENIFVWKMESGLERKQFVFQKTADHHIQ